MSLPVAGPVPSQRLLAERGQPLSWACGGPVPLLTPKPPLFPPNRPGDPTFSPFP